MENHKNKFAGILLIIVILLLVIIGAVYVYEKNSGAGANTGSVGTTGTQTGGQTSGGTSGVAVAGMQEYTDPNFGFSFWYPSAWLAAAVVTAPFGAQISGGTVVSTLGVGSPEAQAPSVVIEEVHSPNMTITDTGGAGPIGPITYFFDSSTHTWMVVNYGEVTGVPTATTTANVSNNTMGGLHMFAGTSRFDTAIIPLSSENFLVISDGGGANATALEKTVTATDPSVATPLSITAQTQIVQAEAGAAGFVDSD